MRKSPIVYLLFFISGITALVYEIVWTRMLTLVFGHTVFSVSIVLAAFMAGLGLGSYLFGYAIDHLPETNSSSSGGDVPAALLIYGWVEILICVSGVLLSLLFANFSGIYASLHSFIPESIPLQNLIKIVFAFGLMLIPTTFMGATLPIMSKYCVTDDSKIGTQVSLLYALNTLGAASGCLITGFFLMGTFGVLQTVLLAAGANLLIGVGALSIYVETVPGANWKFRLPSLRIPRMSWNTDQKFWMGISFICGFTALAYEVLWTRLLVFSISSTVYSFSMMLTVFLLGIFLGSLLLIPLAGRIHNVRTFLLILQGGTGLYVIASIYGLESILSAPWNSYNLTQPASAFLRYFKDSAGLMLIPTLLLGMCFPLLIKTVSGGHQNVGKATGQIYSANTFGAIWGSLCAGFLFLPNLGSQVSLTLVATLNLLTMVLLFRTGNYLTLPVRKGLTVVFAAVILFVNMAIPNDLLNSFFMRDSAGKRNLKKLMYFEEGLSDTVAVFKDDYGVLDPTAKRLITNGVSMSASNLIATRYMKLFAHVPILLVDHPDDVLVVCFGTGQTTGAAGLHPRVKTVDSLELSSSVINAGEMFADQNHNVLHNPKVNFVIQDGRNHLLTTHKRYDVITSEPPPPRTAFTVNLYTQEYYELQKKRLKPGGIAAQWIPLHSQGQKEVDMHFKTFQSVFPHTMGWISVANEILIIGSDQPIRIDFEKLKTRLEEPEIKKALADIEIPNIFSFLSNIWFLDEQVQALGKGHPLITDNHPAIEFYLDLGNVIDVPGREKYVFNRAPFEQVSNYVENLSDIDRITFRTYYEAMDLYQRGVMYSNRGQLLKALNLIEDNNLVSYHLQADKNQMARLIELVEENPSNMENLLNLGHSYFQIGEYEKSIGILKMVLEKNPKISYANLYMGYNLLEMGKKDEALDYFKNTAKNDPSQMGTVMREIGLINLLQATEKKPNDKALQHSAAEFYNMKNEYLKSLEYTLKALDEDPMNLKLLQSIVLSYRGLGEAKEVLMYGNRYNLIDPDEIHLQYIMGEIYTKLLKCEKAIPLLKNVLDKDDTYRNAPDLLDSCQNHISVPEI
ncbi:MAG: fused MFS/spermidine synthase [Nitrospina sp.]|jgi:spermidine synthase|nr:fused MFS/spermidine synthase [Nitrospina sp.]MBT3508067.1 fused MFS/spermidine synthase [Nitrospina sp.]MBT3876680.1 fused MFS/spermidine synthase [Nitrospina sp.]MBT4049613.1 fused MFS/spermidine synthase [Nitrospina sp.]MBT4558325.1 fused MFS/spermidine synthase [Nitrospina sp.]